jgi:CheY-like chemotaxis protein
MESAINMAFNEIRCRARLIKEYGRIPPVMAGDGRLSQVMLNLLVNAAQAIDEGDVEHNEIRVRTWVEGAEVLAEVRDTGRGIPLEIQQRIFNPFYTIKEIGQGSGLGLSICERIVRSYDGRIDVESEPDRGSSFVVRLPMAPEREAEARPGSDPGRAAAPEVKGNILVVDDEVHIGKALRRMLSPMHDVTVTTSGLEAKRLLDQETPPYDLVLCDLIMPDCSGIDLHGWLRERQPRLAEGMIFMTGGAFTQRARTFVSRVPNHCLEKPFNPKELLDLVRETILASAT